MHCGADLLSTKAGRVILTPPLLTKTKVTPKFNQNKSKCRWIGSDMCTQPRSPPEESWDTPRRVSDQPPDGGHVRLCNALHSRFHSLAGCWSGLRSPARLWRPPQLPGHASSPAPVGHLPVSGRADGRPLEPIRKTDARRNGVHAIRGRLGQEPGHLQSLPNARRHKGPLG